MDYARKACIMACTNLATEWWPYLRKPSIRKVNANVLCLEDTLQLIVNTLCHNFNPLCVISALCFIVKPLWTAVNALCFIVKPLRAAVSALCFIVRLLLPAFDFIVLEQIKFCSYTQCEWNFKGQVFSFLTHGNDCFGF